MPKETVGGKMYATDKKDLETMKRTVVCQALRGTVVDVKPYFAPRGGDTATVVKLDGVRLKANNSERPIRGIQEMWVWAPCGIKFPELREVMGKLVQFDNISWVMRPERLAGGSIPQELRRHHRAEWYTPSSRYSSRADTTLNPAHEDDQM